MPAPAAARSSARRNPGSVSKSCLPIPGTSEPCPGNRNATRRLERPCVPVQVSRPGCPLANASSRSGRCASASSAARGSRASRAVLALKQTSATGISGCARMYAARSPALRRRAGSVRAESVSRWALLSGTEGCSSGVRRAGASSRITCAFVPPNPKPSTPARRGPLTSHARGCVATSKPAALRSKRELGVVWWSEGGIWRCCSMSSVFIRLGIPAPFSRWPTFVLTEPSARSVPSGGGGKVRASERASMGSPMGVPVP